MMSRPFEEVASLIEREHRERAITQQTAAKKFRRLGIPEDIIQGALALLKDDAEMIGTGGDGSLQVVGGWKYEKTSSGPHGHRPAHGGGGWYVGPTEQDRFWPTYRARLSLALPDHAVQVIDHASDNIVSLCADPAVHGNQRKGLVLGYVQSGKTANYAAVITKSADAGYRLVIVLAGLHNGLRKQTQARLERDLGILAAHAKSWHPLTTRDEDFGTVAGGAALAHQIDLRMIAVVKKNIHRLTNLRNWLKNMPEQTRRQLPTLIIDDEADQASPNTKAARDEQSAINERLREILDLLPTATYLGYTATPFANVLINPADTTDLYPRDFILSLPKPDGYFGSESIFGKLLESDEDATGQDPELDMARVIPLDEIAHLTPTGSKAKDSFEFRVTDSLDRAIRWFILATAIKRARGQHSHTSMLVHTTQFVEPQFAAADAIRAALSDMSPDDEQFRRMWDDENGRIDPSRWGLKSASWDLVEPGIRAVLEDVRIVVDNGESDDRLDFSETAPGSDGVDPAQIQTVIAVGGNTLSRGLTLEGLTVSFFCRRAGTYDALMQMGRWFGFRNGYQDLPRVWVTESILESFRFLSIVEEEIRQDIERYADEGRTPSELAVRIRSHPAIAITSRAKMFFATKLQVGYGGTRLQTFRFHHRDEPTLLHNTAAARSLIAAAQRDGSQAESTLRGKYVLRDVAKSLVTEFLESYRFHESHSDLDSRAMCEYLIKRQDRRAESWSVAIAGRSTENPRPGGQVHDLGTIELGLPEPVPMINRARIQFGEDSSDSSAAATADVKALMSRADRFLDVPLTPSPLPARESEITHLREELTGGRGLLVLYPISPRSVPLRKAAGEPVAEGSEHGFPKRVPLEAVQPIIGVGIIFPQAFRTDGSEEESDYVGVDLPVQYIEEDESAVDPLSWHDTEGEAAIDLGATEGSR